MSGRRARLSLAEIALNPGDLGQNANKQGQSPPTKPRQRIRPDVERRLSSVDVRDTNDFMKCRYIFLIMGMLGIAILFIVRVNLSVAIVAMVNNTALDSQEHHNLAYNVTEDDVCPGELSLSEESAEDGEFVWDEEKQGYILSGYFYGYAIGQIPGGLLAERYGGKLVFGLGVFLSAALTIISPFCVWFNDDFFFTIRLLEGLAGSVTFPAIQFMISRWAPPQDRSKFSIIFSGGYIGIVLCMPISGLFCDWKEWGGWPLVFYVFGVVGVLWYLPWLYLVHESPSDHPRISKEERRYIEVAIGKCRPKRKLPIPWMKLLSCRGLWACAVMHLGVGWTFYVLLTCLPTYMMHVLRYDIQSNAALSTIPYVAAGIFGVICSPMLDFMINRDITSKMNGFRILIGITAIGPAVTLLIITLVGCNNLWIIILLALNGLCLGAQYTGIYTNLLELAPNFSGTTLGISNTFCNGAGILAPIAVGLITNNQQTRTQWNIVFYVSAAISLVTFVFYLFTCSDEEEPWNNPPDEDEVEPKLPPDMLKTRNGSHTNDAYTNDGTQHL